MNYKHTFIIGLNDQKTKTQLISTDDAQKKLYTIVFKYGFEGGTVTRSTGFYLHDDGSTILENSLKLEIITFDKKELKKVFSMSRTFKKLFNQESIVLNTEKDTSRLF